MELLINQYLPTAILIISVLAFLVTLITELIKDLSFMKKVPTNLLVLVISITLTVLAYVICCSVKNYTVYWYGIVSAFFGGFIVAYIATYGWDKLNDLFKRFKKKDDNEDN